MKELTVKQLAVIAGVSVRTLHHYDEIGLLAPAHVGANGYRYYGRAEMLRLQRILFHRELGVPLAEIGALLMLEGEDQIGALMRHRERLEQERARFGVLIETIDRTVADMRGETTMTDADLYRGFSEEKQAEYEAWLIDQYGDRMKDDIARSKAAMAKMPGDAQAAMMETLRDIETALAEAMRRGIDPAGEAVSRLLERHRAWVGAAWGRACEPDAYAGLADLYLSHPDFVKRFETIGGGFSVWLTDAMKAHAIRQD